MVVSACAWRDHAMPVTASVCGAHPPTSAHSFVSHAARPPTAVPAARYRPEASKARAVTADGGAPAPAAAAPARTSVVRHSTLRRSQILTVPSTPPDAR